MFVRHVNADRATVFNLLAEVGLWPALFPHVRSARVLRRNGRRRLVVMRVHWHGLPLGYTAIQTIDADQGRMMIRHVRGLSRGSVSIWTVLPATGPAGSTDGVDVTVHQQVAVPVPIVGGLLARRFVGGRIARDLGQAMLDRLVEVAEGGSLAGQR